MPRIKAVFFDLDDTLYDCSGALTDGARRRAAQAMVQSGLPLDEEAAYQLQVEMARRHGPRFQVFDRIAEEHGMGEDFVEAAMAAYNSDDVNGIAPFSDVAPTLQALQKQGFLLFLVTNGVHARQRRKIDLLGIGQFFDEIVVNDRELGHVCEESYLDLMNRYGLAPAECVAVGDRIFSEIRVANHLQMITVQMIHGRFKSLLPKSEMEEADYQIARIGQLPDVLAQATRRHRRSALRVVAIGGGTGLPIVLEGLKGHTSHLTAIVTVTDSGRSSGMLRRSLGVLPPGDARNCLVALSSDSASEKLLFDLFCYRFCDGELDGMSFGNLFLAALEKMTGSFEKALRAASRILAVEGKVLPSTLSVAHICARLADGTVLREEYNVRGLNKPPIEEVFLEPEDVAPSDEALDEIARADVIVLGPGSLFTSVITNLLVPGVSRAIRQSKAPVAYVCNVVTQPGQTDRFNASDHVRAIQRYLGEGALNCVFVNDHDPGDHIMAPYREEGAELVLPDEGLEELGVGVLRENLVEAIDEKRILWEKQDLLRHDPHTLGELIMSLPLGAR